MICRTLFSGALVLLAALAASPLARAADDWEVLFNGKDLTGWKINESPESWKIADGALVANGNRSHAYYIGDDKPYKNFEFECEVMTKPGSNGGICFHTQWHTDTWPTLKSGYESQVNISQGDHQKTGGLYNTVKVLTPPAKDDTWWKHYIKVEGKHIVVKIDGATVVDYTEPAEVKGPNKVGSGYFCLQAHDPGSTVYYRNIRAKRLPD